MLPRARSIVVGGLSLALIVASTSACAPDTSEADAVDARSDAAAPNEPTDPDGPGVSNALLDVVAPLVGGGSIDLSGYSGRPLALWFWAPG
jgi:hypothetical protein